MQLLPPRKKKQWGQYIRTCCGCAANSPFGHVCVCLACAPAHAKHTQTCPKGLFVAQPQHVRMYCPHCFFFRGGNSCVQLSMLALENGRLQRLERFFVVHAHALQNRNGQRQSLCMNVTIASTVLGYYYSILSVTLQENMSVFVSNFEHGSSLVNNKSAQERACAFVIR